MWPLGFEPRAFRLGLLATGVTLRTECVRVRTVAMSSSMGVGEAGLSSPSEWSEDAFLFRFFVPTRVMVLWDRRRAIRPTLPTQVAPQYQYITLSNPKMLSSPISRYHIAQLYAFEMH